MKNLIKKIGQNKFQFFFFIGLVALLVITLVISSTMKEEAAPPQIDDGEDPIVTPLDPVVTAPVEVVLLPFDENMDYVITRKYYDRNDTKENQELSLIKYNNTFRTSNGVAYAKKDGTSFDVTSILSGKVIEVKNNPLFGTYVVVESDDNIKIYYYGLSEVCVTVGMDVSQKTKLGVSGETEIDKEALNHVYIKVMKNGEYLNPEKLIGKKVTEL